MHVIPIKCTSEFFMLLIYYITLNFILNKDPLFKLKK